MKKPFFSGLHPVAQLLMLVLTTLISYFVFAFIGILIVVGFYDISLADLVEAIGSGGISHVGVLKVLQITQSIGIFIVPAFILAWSASAHPAEYLGLNTKTQSKGWLLMLGILLAAQPLVIYTGELNQLLKLPEFLAGLEQWMQEMEDKAMELTESFLTVTTVGGLLVNLLMIAILPGLGEELFFRGLIQKLFSRWFKNVHVAVVLTAILFSALHMQFYGFLPRFLLGLLFGYLFVWSGNLWLPIVAHLVHNSIPVVLYFLYAKGLTGSTPDDVGTGSMAPIWALVGLAFLITFSWQFQRLLKEKQTKNLE